MCLRQCRCDERSIEGGTFGLLGLNGKDIDARRRGPCTPALAQIRRVLVRIGPRLAARHSHVHRWRKQKFQPRRGPTRLLGDVGEITLFEGVAFRLWRAIGGRPFGVIRHRREGGGSVVPGPYTPPGPNTPSIPGAPVSSFGPKLLNNQFWDGVRERRMRHGDLTHRGAHRSAVGSTVHERLGIVEVQVGQGAGKTPRKKRIDVRHRDHFVRQC